MAAAITVALCDDARGVKMMVRHFLEEDGEMTVLSSTSTGAALLAELPGRVPEVLLLDVVLPDVTDLQSLVANVRAIAPAISILLISNMAPDLLEDEARRVGADGWLPKASKPEELRAAVRAAARAQRA